jgi:hypothetical protein
MPMGYGLDDLGLTPGKGKCLSLLHSIKAGSGDLSVYYLKVIGDSLPGG